jgi:branched-chain amino acid transport system permease protein
MTTFLQLVVVGLSTGSVFALVGIGLVLVYRTTGIVNFAQGVFVVIGGLYTFRFAAGLPLAVATLVAVAIAAAVASILAVVAVGFRGRTTSLGSIIITLGASFLAEAVLLLEFGDIPRTYRGIAAHAWNVHGVLVHPQYVLIAGVALLSTIGLTLFLRRTILGQALVASSDSRRAAELVGLNIRSLAVVAFVGAGALCALGGALLAPISPVSYTSDVSMTVNGFAAAVFGGLASVRLALVGGYALGILEQLVVGYIDPQYSLVIALVVMLALIGWRSRRELAGVAAHAHAAVHRARVPWPAPVRLSLIAIGTALACWLAYRLAPANVILYDRMGLYALAAVGLTLLMGFAGQVSLGQGAFFLIGAYTSAVLTVGVDPAHRLVDPKAGISPLLAVLAAPLVAAVLAAVIGVPLLRLRGHYLAFATLALHLIAFSLLYAWDRFSGGQYGITVTKPLEVAGRVLRGADHAAAVWGLVGLVLVLATNLVHSRVGRALQAIATDEASAAASGVPVASYKLRLFVFAAALAGLGGGLFTFSFQFVSPEAFPVVLSVEFVVMVAVGGLGNVYGAVAGTIAILYLEQKLRDLGAHEKLLGWHLPDAAPTVFSYGVFGLILICIMLFFPRGLLPALGDAAATARRESGRFVGQRRRTLAPRRSGRRTAA